MRRSPRLPADRDRLDPTQDFDQGPPGPVPVAPCRVFVSPLILLCATDEDATRHPCAASETPVAGRTALPATPPTRQGPIFGGIAGGSVTGRPVDGSAQRGRTVPLRHRRHSS
ncbi:hypothetical protein E1182_12180 [Micromonospora sp. KC721]|nr:hypothetical protein E1182_12180 [Micromonospora sp. KC721]